MGLVVKITSFLYRYLNGRDEKFSSKNRVPGGEIVLEGGVLGGDYCTDRMRMKTLFILSVYTLYMYD